jgi:hypothetical protein
MILLLIQMVFCQDRRVSSTQLKRPIGKKGSISPPWKTQVAQRIPFKIKINTHRETMYLTLLLITQMVYFGQIYEFLQISWIGLFGTYIAYLHLEKSKLPEVFFLKGSSILTENQCATFWSILCRWFSFRDTGVSSTPMNGLTWNKVSLSQLWKTLVVGSIPLSNLLNSHREMYAECCWF